MTILRSRILPVLAGAAAVVGGLDLTAYAGDGHAVATERTATATSAVHLGTVGDARATQALDAPRVGHAFKYVIPKRTPVPFGFRLKGLPTGNYLASFDIAMSTSVLEPPFCNVQDSTTPFAVFAFGTVSDGAAHTDASGIIHVTQAGDAKVFCDQADATINFFNSKNYVVLTPLVKVTRGDVGELRHAPTPAVPR